MESGSHTALTGGQPMAWEHPGREFLRFEMQALINKVQNLDSLELQDESVTTLLYKKALELQFRYKRLPGPNVEYLVISSFNSEMETFYIRYENLDVSDVKFGNLDISDLPHRPEKHQSIASAVIPYQYIPLQPYREFRIVHLRPGKHDSRLHCDIENVTLSQPPDYEALSYTWGDPKGESQVPCRGDAFEVFDLVVGGDEQNLRIGYNLMCALKRIRHEAESRTLWVDAICINQEDDQEKSWQVKSMAQIYKHGSKVIAWLGEHDEYVDLAFDTLEDICWATKAGVWSYFSEILGVPLEVITADQVGSMIESAQERGDFPRRNWSYANKPLIRAFDLTPLHKFDGASLPESTKAGFGSHFASNLAFNYWGNSTVDFEAVIFALRNVFSRRAYWLRLWIIQEFIHGQSINILCGTREMDMDLFPIIDLAICRNWPSRLQFIPGLWDEYRLRLGYSIAQIGGLWDLKYAAPSNLLAMMDLFSLRKCSEPRDNIFALLNISVDIPIQVDYHADIGAVFLQATRAIIQQEKSLDVIFRKPDRWNSHSPTVDKEVRGPTWVPKFHAALQTDIMNVLGTRYNAGPKWSSSSGLEGDDPAILKISGICTGNVVQKTFDFTLLERPAVALIWDAIMGIRRELGLEDNVGEQCETILNSNPKKRDAALVAQRSSIFWETLMIGTYESYEKTKYTTFVHIQSEQPVAEDVYANLCGAATSSVPESVLLVIWTTLNGKKLAVLNNGDLALVNGDPEQGDLVFVAEGASLPLVIRPVNRSFAIGDAKNKNEINTNFEFVGGAYIHGLMDGELVERQEGENWKWRNDLRPHDIRLI